MAVHRIKRNFTAGELSPLMYVRDDFERFKNGSRTLKNMEVRTQGPATRRSGLKFIPGGSLRDYDIDPSDPLVRQIDFVFNDSQAYALTFFMKDDGVPSILFGTGDGLVVNSGDACPTESEFLEEYTGAGVYTVTLPTGETALSTVIEHIDPDTVWTSFADPADYTISWADEVGTITVVNATIPSTGNLRVTVTAQRAAGVLGEVVVLDLLADWDIENFDYAQSGDYLYIAQAGLKPHAIIRRDHDCWELVELSFINSPTDWSDDFGWPETVTLHQQRLLFGGNSTRRQTVWTSMAGSFHDFTTADSGGVVADDHSIVFTLDSGTQNQIRWMQSSKALAIGTLGNEWTVTSSIGSLTPTNIISTRQTNHGSEKVRPLMIGLATMYLERHGRSVNEFIYEDTYGSYQTHDLSVLAPHLTLSHSIAYWAYQQTPDNVLWCVRGDGDMIALTYQRAHKVAGWHHHDTQGSVRACTTIPGSNREDELWLVVEREISGQSEWYIEKKDVEFMGEDTTTAHFLDSYGLYDDEPTSTITGLDHLEGMEVDILADGSVHPSLIVVNGEIELNNEYSIVCVGLSYVSEIRPLLPSLDLATGTSDGRMQRITDLDVFLYNSLGLTYGRIDSEDGEHAEAHPFRVPGDLTGQAVPLFNGTVHINFPEGYDRDSDYFIRQTQPLPLTVLGIVDVSEAYK